ncbi:MAG: 23S rRNA (pseudouridine(1915)-N(3))-methyltransferase RlmH [Erysipelotrichaceae bacterium]|jgi:23S rRNA (pseudouridine1915-N3)-methyltransferase|nr:23S rRNA (pseudouridine(1915)-N(3))-methyltransferase RlmH [Erysipelotrichaceae bacterium]
MIRLLACGSMKEKWMRDGMHEYAKRIQSYDKLEIIEVPDEKAPENNSEAQNEKVKEKEGQRLLNRIKADEFVILLDLAGKTMDSVELSEEIDALHTQGKSKIDFVIGGSLGVSKDLIARADHRWCLSKNTFPHQLCRIIVLEQIYRAFRILHHEPYHK